MILEKLIKSIEVVTRPTGVQFGHAGASASGEKETASAKNRALREAGAIVPDNFDLLGVKIGEVYGALVKKGKVIETLLDDIRKEILAKLNCFVEMEMFSKSARLQY